jgi:ubiquinone/menaquinone biosynthesis C-methylase UbiE
VNLSSNEIPGAFDVGAPAYDKLVDANPGYHMHLRLSAQRMRIPHGGKGLRLLDAGCGTGASTAALLTAAPQAEIVAVDASGGMLAEARAKSWPSSVSFVRCRIEDLAEAGVSGPFDGILAAYLVRNVDDKDGQLRRFRELLRPGGTLAVHEYSVRDSKLATAVWNTVCTTVIIPSGRLRTGDASLYTYLRRSVNRFDGARAFRNRMKGNGFEDVRSETMPGWQRNIVHTFLGRAPR